MEEIWKDVVGFEGYYQVSNLGNFRSTDRTLEIHSTNQYGDYTVKKFFKGSLIKPMLSNSGYLRVGVRVEGHKKFLLLHREVAKAFIPNPNNLPQVNHIDEDKMNNKVSNLEWCTAKYNANYGTRSVRVGINKGRKVAKYALDGNRIREYHSASEAARDLGKSTPSCISACCRGERKSAYGYKWRYVD